MENFNQAFFEFDYTAKNGFSVEKLKTLENYLKKLNLVFKKENENFADLCFYVYQVRALFYSDYCWSKNKTTMYQFRDIMLQFGINESEQSRLCACYDKYIETELSEDRTKVIHWQLKPIFFPFSKSKLFELLPVNLDQLELDIKNLVVRPDMSVKSIRDYVKNFQTIQKQKRKLNEPKEEKVKEEIVEEDIPMVYNPKQHYDFSYFETKTKSQLLNMIWDLQKEYEKLKSDIKKKR